MSKVKIIQSFEKGIVVMHNAGLWMEKSGLKPNKWWKPENMNRNFILKHTEPDEFYVALVGDKPAASMVLQETERNQSWKSVDGDKPKRALYLHWLCVQRDFAGKGFPKVMVEFAKGAEKPTVKGGFLGVLELTADQVLELAKLPGKNELIVQLLGGLQSPAYGLVNVLQGNLRKLVYVLDAVKAKKS